METENKVTEAVSETAEEVKGNAAAAEATAEEKAEKKGFLSENRIELITAIFLGLTALLMAWATWIGSLHGGNQATNYAKSNNLAAEANAEYNWGAQLYFSDIIAWNTMLDYQFDMNTAKSKGDTVTADEIATKLAAYKKQNTSAILQDVFDNWVDGMESPFDAPGVEERYYEKYYNLNEQSQAALEEGQRDNANGDAFNLVTVIYSLVLFLLGIVGIFKRLPNRAFILGVSVVGTVLTTVYMFTIPMPTGFDITSFFG